VSLGSKVALEAAGEEQKVIEYLYIEEVQALRTVWGDHKQNAKISTLVNDTEGGEDDVDKWYK
jgi:hypothetical protein